MIAARDETTIAVCLRLFARARTPKAMLALGEDALDALLHGATFAEVKARDWLRKAAAQKQGEAVAELEYLEGRDRVLGAPGVLIDLPAAAKHFQKAADGGHALAKVFLALLYVGGEGVPADRTRAARLAAEGLSGVKEEADRGECEAQDGLVKERAVA